MVVFHKKIFFLNGQARARGVAISYCRKKYLKILNKFNDKSGAVLITEVKIRKEVLFPEFTIHKQEMSNLPHCLISVVFWKKIDDVNNKSIASAGDFTLTFKTKLEGLGENPALKKTSFAKIIQIKGEFDLCDIWRIRHPNTKC